MIFSILTICFVGISSPEELTVLYWGDFQSQNKPILTEKDGRSFEIGGAALLSGMINQLRSQADRVLTIDIGNQFPGTPISSISKGASQIEILNRIGIDVFVPGTHEFDFGWESLRDVTKKAKFNVLLANVINQNTGKTIFPPHQVINLKGVDIAILGLIDPKFQQVVVRDGVIGTLPLDPAQVVTDFVATYADSVDLLIAATNLGWQSDSTIAADISGLDLIIGKGNSPEIIPTRKVNETIIAQAGTLGQTLGYITLEVDTQKKSLTSYNSKLIQLVAGIAEPDQSISNYVNNLEDKYRNKYKRPIGRLETDWNISRDKPSNLAQWVADALHAAAPTNLSVINNDAIKSGVKHGTLTEWDIWQVCPMEYSIMVFQISGPALRYVINRQVSLANNPDHDFLTWSGLEIVVENGKLKSLTASNIPISDFDEFSVVTIGNIWDGFPFYLGLQQFAEERPFWFIPDRTLRDVLIETIEQRKVISTPLDNRWLEQ